MSDHAVRPAESPRTSWLKRRRAYFFFAALAIGTSQWALKQLGWLFGWTAEPVQDRFGQIFDATVILAAGIVLMVYAIRHICRVDNERKATLDRLHDLAVKAKEART